jgi:hypothetical protein
VQEDHTTHDLLTFFVLFVVSTRPWVTVSLAVRFNSLYLTLSGFQLSFLSPLPTLPRALTPDDDANGLHALSSDLASKD